MEDLGNINITIRETGGGRGASGGVGGGPGPGVSPSQREIAEAITAIEVSQKQAMASVQLAQQQIKQPPVQGLKMFDPILRRQEVSAELLNFMRRPSFAGATGLLREGMATRTMLSGLGKAGVGLGAGLLAVGGVASGVAVALKAFDMAASHAAERIDATWRYSAQTASAMAEQQISQIASVIDEVQMNAELYASVIRSETVMLNERAKFNAELAKTTSVLARTFNQLKTAGYSFGRTMLQEEFIEKALPGGASFKSGIRAMEISEQVKKNTGLGAWQQVNVLFTKWIGGDEAAKKLTQSYMAQIARNTRQDPTIVANEWFQADIKQLTGKAF